MSKLGPPKVIEYDAVLLQALKRSKVDARGMQVVINVLAHK
jgi:hypothetical protein